MLEYAQEQIRNLYLEFSSIRRYADKLIFYDMHFDIIPFTFPPFQTDLYAFFSDKSIDALTNILHQERKSSYAWEQVFSFENESYTFCIKPWNDNHLLLKQFILNKIISGGPQPEEIINKRIKYSDHRGKVCAEMLEISRQMIKYLKYKTEHEFERNFKMQFITVFLKGVADCQNDIDQMAINKKRKFIELYLYAQGILYGRYLNLLEKFSQLAQRHDEFPQKLQLLNELGIVDAIKRKYLSLSKIELDKKVEELLLYITGERQSDIADLIDRSLKA